MGFKIAVDAGHGLTTAGKRVDPSLDAKQTKEWTLNNRVAKFEMEAADGIVGVNSWRMPSAKDNRIWEQWIKKPAVGYATAGFKYPND